MSNDHPPYTCDVCDLPIQTACKHNCIETLKQEVRRLQNRRMKRMWINQPSTLQPLHSLHGIPVLVDPLDQELRAYPAVGSVTSLQLPDKSCLSNGWPGTVDLPTLGNRAVPTVEDNTEDSH